MIDPKELRIGNWICGQNDPPMIVREIKEDGIQCSFGWDHLGAFWYYEGDDLHGIPLTPEVLEAAGFEESARWSPWSGFTAWTYIIDLHGKKEGGLLIGKNEASIMEYHIEESTSIPVGIKYLHQLQNLYFSLTGKELEIKMPILKLES